MFFLLSHFPICNPICQCHLCLRLSECSFTPANRVVLTTDDDVDRGDGLRECKFIYVALFLSNSLEMPHCNAMLESSLHLCQTAKLTVCGPSYIVFTRLNMPTVGCLTLFIINHLPNLILLFVMCEWTTYQSITCHLINVIASLHRNARKRKDM